MVTHYPELYPNIQDYTDQIRMAEKQRDANPELAPLHLLLGYHFGYLGYPKQAVKELEKAVELSPRDEIAHKLLDLFAARLNSVPKPAEIISEPAEAGKEAGERHLSRLLENFEQVAVGVGPDDFAVGHRHAPGCGIAAASISAASRDRTIQSVRQMLWS